MNLKRLYEPPAVSPAPVFQLINSDLLYSVVTAANKAGIFDVLCAELSVSDLAAATGLHAPTLAFVLPVLMHAGFVEKTAQGFVNSELSNSYMGSGSPYSLAFNFKSDVTNVFEAQLADTLAGTNSGASPEPNWNPDRIRQLGAFALSGAIQAAVNSCPLPDCAKLLDLGGGHGLYAIAFAQKYPELEAVIFDLPRVIPAAQENVRRFGLEDRVSVQGGNFLTDNIGQGFDAVLCANILHSAKRDAVLPKVFNALTPGGKIIVKCRIDDAEDNLDNALAKLVWHVRGGKELFSRSTWHGFLQDHGFTGIETVNVTGIFATIVGTADK